MTADPRTMRRHPLLRRIDAHHASRSFGTVLVLIGASFVFGATASDAAWTTGVLVVLQGLTLIAALWTSGLARARSWLVFGLAMLAIAIGLAVVSSAVGGADLIGGVGVVSALLSIGVVVVIARSIARSPEVSAQTILGAICIYVSIGIIFVFAYGAVADIGSSPFFAQAGDGTRALRLYFSYVTLATLGYGDYTPATNLGHMLAVVGSGNFFAQGTDGTRSIRLYFSFVTLATLGYGDYTPGGNLGHLLAVLEALIGQLYLVIVLTVMLTRLGQSHRGRAQT